MHTLHTQLATVFATLNTHNDVVLASAIQLHKQFVEGGHYNGDGFIDDLNETYDEDVAACGSAERAATAMARDLLHAAVTAYDVDWDVDAAINLLAQAIIQRSYALQQVYA